MPNAIKSVLNTLFHALTYLLWILLNSALDGMYPRPRVRARTGGGRAQKRKRVKHVKLPYMGHLTKYNPILPSIMAVSLPGASRPVRDSVVDDVHDAQGAVCHAVCMYFTVS